MPPLTFNEKKALELYHDHKTDQEIAKGAGGLTTTISSWRKRKGMPNISPNARIAYDPRDYKSGVDYRKALDPSQAVEMNRFLSTLLWAAEIAKEAGVKPNVDNFIKAWMGLPITEEGKKARRNDSNKAKFWQQRRLKRGQDKQLEPENIRRKAT